MYIMYVWFVMYVCISFFKFEKKVTKNVGKSSPKQLTL